jgi:hypothetical protein
LILFYYLKALVHYLVLAGTWIASKHLVIADDFVVMNECLLLMKEDFDVVHAATVSAFAPLLFTFLLLLILF